MLDALKRRFQNTARLVAVLALALSAAGCGALPGERQVKQFLGLERPFSHNDLPSPPSPGAYVRQLGMAQTYRIVVRAQPGARSMS